MGYYYHNPTVSFPNTTVFRERAFGRWLVLDEVKKIQSPWWDYCPYKKRRPECSSLPLFLPLPLFLLCEDNNKKMAISKPRVSPHQTNTQYTDTLILRFPASRMWEINACCCLSLPKTMFLRSKCLYPYPTSYINQGSHEVPWSPNSKIEIHLKYQTW